MIEGTPTKLSLVDEEKTMSTGFEDIKSSCGDQVDSRKCTAPTASFGNSTRPKIIPQGASVPGPGAYKIPPSIGRAVVSTVPTVPAISISGREKFGSTADLKEAANSPGPGEYKSRIVNPKEKSAPQHSLGRRWTTSGNEIRKSPGPGEYENAEHFNKTPLSTKANKGDQRFGTGKRPPLLQTSAADLGPGEYPQGNTAVGRQTQSVFKNTAMYSFSMVGRSKAAIGERMSHDKIPGPGAYKLRPAVGPQVTSTMRSGPRFSMSGRNKFGSHF